MKKGRTVLTALVLVASVSVMVGCATSPPAQTDFNLIFRYGVVPPKNELNTFNGTYRKDMVADPSITIDLSLSQEELDRIRQKMVEVGFFDYTEPLFPESIGVAPAIPAMGYYFKVEYGSKGNELQWTPKYTDNKGRADKLRELIKLITDIIESKEEYKKLPEPTSAYL